ncbi:MAG: hypothetical protein U9R19_02180 [Bacteroidota bacterium]|nr:hypothetical protein [Bacteroidota bacterium]
MKISIGVLLLTLLFSFPLFSQDKGVDFGVDLASRYIWRGADYGRSPSIQPRLEFSFGKLQVGAWGAFTTSQFNTGKAKSFVQETDIYINYDINEMFSLSFTDYFFPDDALAANNYYNFDKDKTGHIFEGTVNFNGTKNLPISIMLATNFYGADAKNADGNIFYSTYIELGYSKNWKGTDLDFFIGGTPNTADTKKKESGFYANSPNIVNIGITASKEIKVTDNFKIPVSVSFITNPDTQNVFFVFVMSF